jgi:hypothetical protein
MAMTNAERQARWRAARRGKLADPEFLAQHGQELEQNRLLRVVRRRALALDRAVAQAKEAGTTWYQVNAAQEPLKTFHAWLEELH